MALIDFEGRGIKIEERIAKMIPKWRNKLLRSDDDKFILIDGREGAGKSSLALQIASCLDPNFNIDKICFSGEDFSKAVKSLDRRKADALVLDESYRAVGSRNVMSSVNKAMVALGTEMRQLNLFVIIVLPSFFDLDKYYGIWRSDFLIHVYMRKDGRRGVYMIFTFKKKKKLYLDGKRSYNYVCVRTPLKGLTFNKGYGVIDDLKYREKKVIAFRYEKKPEGIMQKRRKKQLIMTLRYLHDEVKLIDKDIGEIIDLDATTVNLLRNEA